MTTTAGRRLRAVPPLPGQLSLDLPGIPTAGQVAELTAARTARPGRTRGGGVGESGRARRLVRTREVDVSGPGVVARVPVAVWAVWDEEDLVGVYAAESTARADAAVLARDAVRSGRRRRLGRTAGAAGRLWGSCRLRRAIEDSDGARPRPVLGAAWSLTSRTTS